MTNSSIATPADSKAVLATGISAKINGETYHCEIHRSDLRHFERVFGPALYNLNRIRENGWDSELVRSVLEFSTGPRPKPEDTPETFQMMFMTSSTRRRGASSWIDDAFAANGPLRYAGLAGLILAAALAGVPPEDATFDDGEM
ncbi:hypothetical protein [Pararhizobium gei]|uniref:hypothetical protein n=1 Tax=Pararhizobium gei TaxID=1395951 RepID=UPI0023DCB611|nr:hypothetical protein [Rhizobium gei]